MVSDIVYIVSTELHMVSGSLQQPQHGHVRNRCLNRLPVVLTPMCFATSGCVCVRSSMRFLNLWLQIALEWLLHCRHLMLPRA